VIAIYGLTEIGHRLARSTHGNNSSEWRVVHYLDKMRRSTPEQISDYCGLSSVQTAVTLRKLKGQKIVAEETSSELEA